MANQEAHQEAERRAHRGETVSALGPQISVVSDADGDWVSLGAHVAKLVQRLAIKRAERVLPRSKRGGAHLDRDSVAAREGLGSNLE